MRNSYKQTFKDESVALVLGSNEPVSRIAIALGIHEQTLGNWVRKSMSESKSKTISKPSKQDYQGLERE